MFQGTILVADCLERMLRALRIPVEKLQRREIQSLLQRLTFLDRELGRVPAMAELKAALAQAYGQGLGLDLEPGGLTVREKARLDQELEFYSSPAWVHRRRLAGPADEVLRAQSGRLRAALWVDLGRGRIKQALLSGDFFTRPARLVLDVEAALKGCPLQPEPLEAALARALPPEAELEGVTEAELVRTVVQAATKGAAPWPEFQAAELNQVHPLGLDLDLAGWRRPEALLLPYCAKDLACPQRHEPGYDQCGQCEVGDLYNLAGRLGLRPLTITSFEHLMAVLDDLARAGSTYLASCCQAFLAKHQVEMEGSGAQGVVVSLDSLTCYDLGKENQAYHGRFENQSRLPAALLAKVVEFLSGPAWVGARAQG
jgi:lipoate-protein ligase A